MFKHLNLNIIYLKYVCIADAEPLWKKSSHNMHCKSLKHLKFRELDQTAPTTCGKAKDKCSWAEKIKFKEAHLPWIICNWVSLRSSSYNNEMSAMLDNTHRWSLMGLLQSRFHRAHVSLCMVQVKSFQTGLLQQRSILPKCPGQFFTIHIQCCVWELP